MKRSEMLVLIQKEIDDYVENGYLVNPEGILEAIEKAGMLPPPKDTDVINSRLVYVYYDEDNTNIVATDDCKLDFNASKLWDEE